jgi:hypothetical protein
MSISIDKAEKWWKGTESGDLKEYLSELAAEVSRIDEFRLARCNCGSSGFRMEADRSEGVAQKTCVSCGVSSFICDSHKYWEDAKPKGLTCTCGAKEFNVGVGFSLRKEKQDIRWLYVGARCLHCGILGCFVDWKVNYSPSLQLLDQV